MKDLVFQDILFEFDEITSTQEKAKQIIELGEGGDCFAVLAKSQTAGRGRLKREWVSEGNGNLYLSIALKEELTQNMGKILPLYSAFSLINAIGEKAKYKWVNDVIIENKKIAGILIEKINGFFIIGIGVNRQKSPENCIFPAGSLAEFGESVEASDIFKAFKQNLNLSHEVVIKELENRFFSREEITINQGEFRGVFHKITAKGNLVLIQSSGDLKEISFGDVGINC